MLRLTLLLAATMFAVLMTLGEDRGQQRPGLARATVEPSETVIEVAPAPVIAAAEEPAAPVPEPEPAPEPDPRIVAEPENQTPEQPREVVQVLEDPVFSLSSLGNELVPGESDAPRSEPAGPAESEEGAVWYVTADSVNVRAEPSTQAEILGRLGSGEAALLVAEVDGDWARIIIQGDGLEGYVARRYLSPEAP